MLFLKALPKIIIIVLLFTLAGTGLMLYPGIKEPVNQFYQNYLSSIPVFQIARNTFVNIKKQASSQIQTLQNAEWQDIIDEKKIPSFSIYNRDLKDYQLAEGFYSKGNYQKALSMYCNLAEKYPDSPETLYSLALTFAKQGAYDEANTYMLKAAEIMDFKHPEVAKKWTVQAFAMQQRRAIPFEKPLANVAECHERLIASEKKQQEKN